MTASKETEKSKLKKFMQTKEYETLAKLEESMDMRLDGLAFFLSNNPVVKSNDN